MTVIDPVIFFFLSNEQKKVTLDQVVKGTECRRKAVLRVMDKLADEGYLEEVDDNPESKGYKDFGPQKQNPTWLVVKNLSGRPNGQRKKDTDRDKIWRAIKSQERGFTRSDLVRISGATRSAVEDYTKLLEREGYLKTIGKVGRQKRYRLAKEELKRPKVRERRQEAADVPVADNDSGWLALLQQRVETVGGAETARELGVSSGSVSLLLNDKYPASTSKMEEKVLQMYSHGGVIECPALGEITPGDCVDTYNKAIKMGGLGGNRQQTRLYKTCLKCDFRNRQ